MVTVVVVKLVMVVACGYHGKRYCIAVNGMYFVTQLRSVTCHMGSHSVSCHPTQVNSHTACLNPSQTGWYSIYLPPEGWKAELT